MTERTQLLVLLAGYLAQMKTAYEHKDDRDWYYEDSPMIHRVNKARKDTLLAVVEIFQGKDYCAELLEDAMQMLDKVDRTWYS